MIELVTLAVVGEPVEQVEPGAKPHRVNEEVCHMLKPSSDYFSSEVKAIICTILDEDPVTTDPAEIVAACEAMVGIEQPLTGMVVEIDARNIVLNNNKNFTKVKYLREVPATEVLAHVQPDVVARYFPGQVLEAKAAAEAQVAAAQAAA